MKRLVVGAIVKHGAVDSRPRDGGKRGPARAVRSIRVLHDLLHVELVHTRADRSHHRLEAAGRDVDRSLDHGDLVAGFHRSHLGQRVRAVLDHDAAEALGDLREQSKVRRDRLVVLSRRMQTCQPLAANGCGVEQARQHVGTKDCLQARPVAQGPADLESIPVPLLALRVQRRQKEHAAAVLDGIGRIKQQHRAGFIDDPREVLKVRMRPKRRIAVRIMLSGEHQRGASLEPRQQLRSPGRKLTQWDMVNEHRSEFRVQCFVCRSVVR